MAAVYRINDVATRCGISKSTLRQWEQYANTASAHYKNRCETLMFYANHLTVATRSIPAVGAFGTRDHREPADIAI